MAAIDDLISQISDESLRARISAEIKRANKQKKFGLVYEEHLPESTPLYDVPVKKGSIVAKKTGEITDLLYVESITDGQATCISKATKERAVYPVSTLVSVAQFGEPIYPYLKPIDTVCNAPDSDLWHTLIEADNYHALQLLAYLYAGKVDCIYIDPPYNTGARDWKYNNDYVDGADSYRHSKWLSMMEKRLKLAKQLLTKDGVMIVAIDDYEVSRLMQLIEEVFPNYEVDPVIVNHHPQGGAADNISRTHEYALFVVPRGLKIIKGNKTEDVEERWSLTRGGTDVRNLRRGRPNSFYAIYVNRESKEVIGVGPHLDADTPYDKSEAPEGCIAFYPVGRDGTERVWRYERESMMQHIEAGDIICTDIIFVANIDCMENLHTYARQRFHDMNDDFRRRIPALTERYRKKYDSIVSDGDIVSKHNFRLPETISMERSTNGDAYSDHLFIGKDGTAVIALNNWEKIVLRAEQTRPDYVCWLRNPPRKPWALCIPYEQNGDMKSMYPDFLIVRKDEMGYVIDILEPHAGTRTDNLGKAKGFAEYARQNPGVGRLQLIRIINGQIRRLDMSRSSVRDRVSHAMSDDDLNYIFDEVGFSN